MSVRIYPLWSQGVVQGPLCVSDVTPQTRKRSCAISFPDRTSWKLDGCETPTRDVCALPDEEALMNSLTCFSGRTSPLNLESNSDSEAPHHPPESFSERMSKDLANVVKVRQVVMTQVVLDSPIQQLLSIMTTLPTFHHPYFVSSSETQCSKYMYFVPSITLPPSVSLPPLFLPFPFPLSFSSSLPPSPSPSFSLPLSLTTALHHL